jgi:hypothetical protein
MAVVTPRTRSASTHPRTRSPSRTHTDRPVVNGRACSGPSRRPPGAGSLRPSPSTVPDPPTGSPRNPARVLSRLRPLAHGQGWSGPRTYPGQVHCLGRPLVVSLRWTPVGGRPCSSVFVPVDLGLRRSYSAVTVSSAGPTGLFKGMTTATSVVLARFPLLLPVRNSFASYGASTVTRTSGRGHVAEA